MVPVLMEGARRGEPESLRCLVHVRFDWEMRTDVIAPELHARSRLHGLLAAAIARNPEAPDLWRWAIHFELSAAEWGMHHLYDGVLLLPERECRRSLERARHILDRAPAEARTEGDRDDLRALDAALTDYSAWKDSETGDSFTEWCQQRGRSYVWPVPIEYDAQPSRDLVPPDDDAQLRDQGSESTWDAAGVVLSGSAARTGPYALALLLRDEKRKPVVSRPRSAVPIGR